jgi:nondiscriminating glutamyl-tRNA synthetase
MKLDLISTGDVRVRFAPSPTGFLHIGSARAALFNYLFAKKNKGSFVLRIEDTDKERSLPEYEENIIDGLLWLGINWDEGPRNGSCIGDYGPYRQSERKIYQKYIEQLLTENKAYRCFCSQEDLDVEKQYLMAQGQAPRYSGKCSTISPQESKEKNLSSSSVIRLRVPLKKIKFKDVVRQEVEFDSNIIGDIVIAKDVETPLYNLAVVIDDYLMKISHVLRGEDHISNTPKQILIAQALDFPIPVYAHLPLVLAPDRSKLSKRHGPVSLTDYKDQGYLPEALINFLALLGWNSGTDKEIYSMSSLIKSFSLEKVQKSGAIFNIKKLDSINSFYLRQKSVESLTQLIIPYLVSSNLIVEKQSEYQTKDSGKETSLEFIQKVVALHQERIKKLSEIIEFADFFFVENLDYPKELLYWKDNSQEETLLSLDRMYKILSEVEIWNSPNIEQVIVKEAEETGDRGKVYWPLRVALTGKKSSAGPIEVAEILGKQESLKRIIKAIEKIK